jgi:hypothetical protein
MRNINRLKKLEDKLRIESNRDDGCIFVYDGTKDADLQMENHLATCKKGFHYFAPMFNHDCEIHK